MNSKRLLFPFFFLLPVFLFSQDIHFSQFTMSPLTANPALAGSMHDLQVNIISREQWRSIGAPFRTVAASVDMRLNPKKRAKTGYLAAGFNVFSDKAGDGNLGVNQANLSLAYHLLLDDNNSIGAGIQGGFAQRSINFNSLSWGRQFDGTRHNPILPNGEPNLPESRAYADLGTGLTWAFNPRYKDYGGKAQSFKAVAGASIFHVNQPNYSFIGTEVKLNMRFVAHANAQIVINPYYALLPEFMYNRQGPAQSFYAGSLVRYQMKQASQYTGIHAESSFALGGFVRLKDAVTIAMQYRKGDYSIGMSYDINTSSLTSTTYGRGGWEISLRYSK